MDAAYPAAADLGRIASQHGVSVRVLFTLTYLVERAALDRLAQDESFGIESEPWPTLTQMLRHASLDVCAAASQHVGGNGQMIIDPLTSINGSHNLLRDAAQMNHARRIPRNRSKYLTDYTPPY